MIGKDSFCANSFECMKTIKGETITKVVQAEGGFVLFFESGYSLTIKQGEFRGDKLGYAVFWVNNREDTERIENDVKKRIDLK